MISGSGPKRFICHGFVYVTENRHWRKLHHSLGQDLFPNFAALSTNLCCRKKTYGYNKWDKYGRFCPPDPATPKSNSIVWMKIRGRTKLVWRGF